MWPIQWAVTIVFVTSVAFTGPAAADPSFQMPFPCGETWHASTYSGHVYSAIDWNAYPNDEGHTVVASAAGTATSHWSSGYGNYVDVNHGGGWTTRYAHLQGVGVSGAVVQGQPIGNVGSTGDTTGPHLHFEVKHNGTGVSPMVLGGEAITPGGSYTANDPSYTSQNSCAPGGPPGSGVLPVKNYARNGGFDWGSTRWSAVNANFQVVHDSTAYSGSGYGRTNTTNNGSLRNDYPLTIDTTDHFCMEAMVRADPGQTTSGALILWLLGGSSNENVSTPFTVGDQWTLVKACTYASVDHTSLSARIYPATGGNTVSVDAVDVH